MGRANFKWKKLFKGVFYLSCLILATPPSWGESLQFFLKDKRIKTLSLGQMARMTKTKDLELHYHLSQTSKSSPKHYRGLAMAPILKAVYGELLSGKKGAYSEIVLEASDGYQAYGSVDTLLTDGGHIAFKDLDVKSGWEPVGREMASPAPYFLVWEREGQTTANGYPWPWNLGKIRLVKFADRYPNVYPKGKQKNSPEYKGYQIFKSQCFRCHAINRQGGKIGPDLAAPKNIFEYRTDEFVRQFIIEPEKFRYSKMPAHQHLSKDEIDSLISYLKSR